MRAPETKSSGSDTSLSIVITLVELCAVMGPMHRAASLLPMADKYALDSTYKRNGLV